MNEEEIYNLTKNQVLHDEKKENGEFLADQKNHAPSAPSKKEVAKGDVQAVSMKDADMTSNMQHLTDFHMNLYVFGFLVLVCLLFLIVLQAKTLNAIRKRRKR